MALRTVQSMSANSNHVGAAYLQSLPYLPPAAPASRRWFAALLAVVALLIVVNVAAVVVLMQRNPNPANAPALLEAVQSPAKRDSASALLAATKEREAGLLAEVKYGGGSDLVKPAAKHPEGLLEAVGGLSVAHLYQSYLNIGLLADAVESETYSDKEAMPFLQKIQELLAGVDKHLDRINKIKLEADDHKALQRLRTISGHLQRQTASLLAYWKAGDEATATRYHEARNQAWGQLKEMLGLPE
jgi:hypothetical protein